MADIRTDHGENYPWRAFKNGDNSFTITCTNAVGGAAFDLSTYTLVLNIRKIGKTTNALQLTEGSGVTNGGADGIITILLSQTQASTTLAGDTYFWEIVYTAAGTTNRMFEGILTLSNELNPSSSSSSLSASITIAGTDVNASITVGSVTSSSIASALGYTPDNVKGATASGTDTYTATYTPAPTAYATGQRFTIIFTNANTGAATLNLNSLGAKSIKKNVSEALVSGDIDAGQAVDLVYDGTNFQIISGSGGSDLIIFTEKVDSYTLVLTDTALSMNKATALSLTVPPNSSVAFAIGTVLYVKRTGAGILTVAQGAGVTVTGSSGALTDAGLNVIMTLIKTGTDTWDLQNGVVGEWVTYAPSYTGFSVDPTVAAARYILIGKMCTVYVRLNTGTSNATTFTITLPFAAANTFTQYALGVAHNNGNTLTTPGVLLTRANSNIADVYTNLNNAGWTASGNKLFNFSSFTYEIA